MKIFIRILMMICAVAFLGGCSSVMTHTGGGEKGVYPGTRTSVEHLGDDTISWGYKPLIILDLPFTAVMDTVLLPWDIFRTDKSVKARVEESEAKNHAVNSVIPPSNIQ
ncbi:YceK/YidQ family lipoprotein [Atlantibacter sp.]|uniref:YceK/YidQ family lipoprotein n=1 Tax=Atlantibacter sp. TaxID=1903473 RepID=UPI0013EF88DC|nr:YceK/YidQ family lipoprotein [Atlantibacter sp.]EJP4074916.1 YceK/YidQ family lipoprotein [Escherichia coli]